MPDEELRRGDLVEVKSPSEILATLDARATLEGLPFMPEMVAYCGRRFTVERRADKVCDTVAYSGSRRLPHAVLLDDLRCDGSGHDGCQAECRLFWKEAWLRKVEPGAAAPAPFPPADAGALAERAAPHTRELRQVDGQPQTRYRCQNTDLPACSELLRVVDPRPYLREFTSGNVSLKRFLVVTARAAVVEPMRKLGLVPDVHLPGSAAKAQSYPRLDLQPGEVVRIKSKEEIAKTLTPKGRHKGLWFDREMLPYCGGTYRVRRRVDHIINEMDGRMVQLKTDAITLEGVVCSGEHSTCRWFCPRAIFPYWRECWLERVEGAKQPAPAAEKTGS